MGLRPGGTSSYHSTKKNTFLYVVPPPELNHPAHELALLQIRARLVHELAHVLASPRHFSAE